MMLSRPTFLLFIGVALLICVMEMSQSGVEASPYYGYGGYGGGWGWGGGWGRPWGRWGE